MINWKRRKYTKEEFVTAWQASSSIAECARKLNLTIYGSTYITLKNAAEDLDLPDDHMTGQGYLKGKTHNFNGRKMEDILIYGKRECTGNLKRRLLKDSLLDSKCSICGITEWLDKPAPLALDHIDGDRKNNVLENLRLLCYNCHGQTETYCRKK